MRKQIIIVIAFLVVLLSSCSVGKRLEQTAWLIIDDSNYSESFNAKSSKYIDVNVEGAYLDTFTQELKSSLSSYNIETVSESNTSITSTSVYYLQLLQFQFSEDFITESVYMDSLATSPEYFDLVTCSIDYNSELYEIGKTGNKVTIKSYNKSVSKEEKLSNNRTFWQIIFGSNKDNSQYTYKELNEDVFLELSSKAARRTAAGISRTLYKKQ